MASDSGLRLQFEFLGEDGTEFGGERQATLSRHDWSDFAGMLPEDSMLRRGILGVFEGDKTRIVVIPWDERSDLVNVATSMRLPGLGDITDRELPDS